MLEICCPSKSRMIFDDDDEFIKFEDKTTKNTEGDKPPPIDIPENKAATPEPEINDLENDMVNENVKALINDIEKIVDEIKSIKTLSMKEESDLNKTFTILRNQLNPKRRTRKNAIKKFNFSILKNQLQALSMKNK